MNDITFNSIAEVKEKPISELYFELFGSEEWGTLNQEYLSVRRAVNEIKRKRDKLNNRTKKSASRRNEKNTEVSSLKKKISQIKQLRDQENATVKNLKFERSQLQKALKETKQKIKNGDTSNNFLNESLEKLIKDHNTMHELVVLAVNDAQATHDEMLKLGDLMSEKRKIGQSHHEEMREIKKQSDLYHHLFIRFLDHQFELEKFIKQEEE